MPLTFKNPLVIATIAHEIDALPNEFSFGWSIRLKASAQPLLPRHFNDALNRLFVSDRPEDIEQLGLAPCRWYGVPEAAQGGVVTLHGHAKVPSPNLCGWGFVTNMCRPSRLFLQSAMCAAGIDCQMALVHIGETLNNKVYKRQWQPNMSNAIWDYVGRAEHGGAPCAASRTALTPITPESGYNGFDWLFGDTNGSQLGASQ